MTKTEMIERLCSTVAEQKATISRLTAERDGLRKALEDIRANALSGEWTLPSTFGLLAESALRRLATPSPSDAVRAPEGQ